MVSSDAQNEIDLDWSTLVGTEAADELVIGKVITKAQAAFAAEIITQVIHLCLVADDRPDFTNRRYAQSGRGAD